MRDSLFYTDEELEFYDNNDVREMELFLEDCDDFKKDIIALSTSLNEDSVNSLNINLDINLLINTIKELKEYKDNINLDDNNRRYVNKRFDELKKELVVLKNKHIQRYNSKVDYINERVNLLTNKLNREVLSNNVNNLLDNLSLIDKCDVYIDGKWDQNAYLDNLDYFKLNELYSDVNEIERLLKIKNNEPIELFSEWNYISKNIKSIEKLLKNEDLSLVDVNNNLGKCNILLERVVDLELKLESMRNNITEEMFGLYNEKKIVKLRNEIKDIESLLLEKKNNLTSKSSYYTDIINELNQINFEYDMLNRKLLEYNGELTTESIGVFNNMLDKLTKKLDVIRDKIKEYEDKGMLNKEQVDNICNKLVVIADKHTKINKDVNFKPEALKDEQEIEKQIYDKYVNANKLLDELEGKISKLGNKVTDKNIRKDVSELIKKCDDYIDGYGHLLTYYNKTNQTSKYDNTKVGLDRLKERYKTICDKYYSKCPLRVKTVRSIKNLYKEHPKIGLISGGLSALSLLFGVHSLIPAIMHGNVVVSNSVPALKGMMNVFNKILGSVIGAKSTIYGDWRLANGVLLNISSATTALLKSLAGFSVSAVSLISPVFIPQLISKIKNLVDKMKKSHLKEKLKDSYNSGIEKASNMTNKVKDSAFEVKEKIVRKKDEKELKAYYQDLYDEYCNYVTLSLDDFCKKYELNDEDKKVLYLMVEVNKLKNEREQELKRILSEKKNNGRNR